ncbi:MAG: glycoside hydrolase family 25 protein [Rhabdochlamydiaceae bacterium]
MATTIVGNDISGIGQGVIDWAIYKNNTNFVLIKASEGNGVIDNEFGNNRQQARDANLPRGFYHFARPDLNNSPQQEAEYFWNLIDGQPIQEGEVLALDYEVTYGDCVHWCKEWLDLVSAHFNGIKPLIYLNQGLAKNYDWSPVVNAGYGLWIASYTGSPENNNAETGKWEFAAIQQWTDKQIVPGIGMPVDGDVFFGDAEQFKAYGYQSPTPTPPVESTNTPSQETQTPPSAADTTSTIEVPSNYKEFWNGLITYFHTFFQKKNE